MASLMNFSAREYVQMNEIAKALSSSLCLPEVLGRARTLLAPLIPSDYMALCIVTPGQPVEYEWMGSAAPPALLDKYAEQLVAEDFVLKAVKDRRDTVLRDSEMISREDLERSLLYQRSRELSLRLEHVMATLLTVRPGVYGGFTLYRDRKRPFSLKSRAMLQFLSDHLANAIRNCRDMATAATSDRLLDVLHRRQGFEFIVLTPPAFEKARSEHATAVLEKWFAKSDRTRSGIPRALLEQLDALTRMNALERPMADTYMDSRDDEYLVVKFVELPEPDGTRPWALLLHQFSHSIPLPDELARQLTPAQVEVAKGILRNWNDRQIAEHLKSSPHTVKTHVKFVYKKLMCDGRADLMYQAARFLKPI
jgi:DNA-binding CsgD family transcriptional regulator